MNGRLEELLAVYFEGLERGAPPDPAELCRDDPDLAAELADCVAAFARLAPVLGAGAPWAVDDGTAEAGLPSFPGYRTVERIGRGGAGDVYKLEDLTLGRTVAAKVLRPGSPLRATSADALREARTLALFEDPHVVRILDVKADLDPPVLLMEYVDGFRLDEIGPSLELAQRARLVAEVAEAVDRAHRLGIQHRDLKPANILVDRALRPRILDFGLSREGSLGHGLGTPAYMAPEQLDPGRPIDARTDVYALGVVLYELLCGARPFAADRDSDLVAAIRAGQPPLPAEVETAVPEPLQAIALKAMERNPADRYGSARELALDLRRFLAGTPVLARPTLYQSALSRRLRPHLEQVREWLRLKLIYPHEADRLVHLYGRLEARDEDWLLAGRFLSLSRIALYLGAYVLVAGGVLYFGAYILDAVNGVAAPLLGLGLPLLLLHGLGFRLLGGERRGVAIAFLAGAAALLPLLLLVLLGESGVAAPTAGDPDQLFAGGGISNRHLQIATAAACGWAGWLALRTRSAVLATLVTLLATAAHLALFSDLGLRRVVEEGRFDLLAVRLLPLALALALLGLRLEARDLPYFARPQYYTAALLSVVVVELAALDGRAFAHLGLSLAPLGLAGEGDPVLLDTLAAMAVNGLLVYGAASLLEARGSPLVRGPARLLFALAPFAVLEPVLCLCRVGQYSLRFDWVYLALAVAIVVASHLRQRWSFYWAGLVNTGCALALITDHRDWLDRPAWGLAVVGVGLGILACGALLDEREREVRRRA